MLPMRIFVSPTVPEIGDRTFVYTMSFSASAICAFAVSMSASVTSRAFTARS